ncbi:MAG: transketolase [Halobacteriovoraceae bacterium]|nr:transketolase [Halobacteriovoraceae bacterium]
MSDLANLAKKIRIHVLNMTTTGKSSHIGSAFSIVDILTVLYSKIINANPKNLEDPNRDKFILSKGHAGAAIYATLAEHGFFDPEKLMEHYQDGSIFSGHVSHKGVPGVEYSTGSLGHGLSVATGMAMANKKLGKKNYTYCLMGDGECDEGAVWEAAMFANHHKLNNLIAIVDYNKIQSLESVADTIALEPFEDKWVAFGWKVLRVDGHNFEALEKTFKEAQAQSKPTVIIADTIKGKGVSFMENTVLWHYRNAQGDEYSAALKELEENS